MQKLKVCFVGIGSIAKRHMNNLVNICDEQDIELEIDALRRPSSSEIVENVQRVYKDIGEMSCDYDVIFITNPTQYHLDTLKRVHEKARHFFIEKPLVIPSMLLEAKNFPYRDDSIYYIACPLRYKRIIQELKGVVSYEKVLSVRAECSSYLPDWRPGIDYRTCYSANRELGGGVSIDLIHEWDYLQYLFGFPKKVLCIKEKFSELEIDTEDYASYIAKYDDKAIELHLDYFGRQSMRRMTIYTADDTIEVDLINNKINYLVAEKSFDYAEERDDFQKEELKQFLRMISEEVENTNGPMLACKTIELTQGIIR